MAPRPAAPAVGVDVASVRRVAEVMRRNPRFAERVLTAAERAYCAGRADRLAARWAVKEAVRKLAGARGVSPLPAFADIEVRLDEAGAPHTEVDGLGPVAVSLSHDAEVAVAVAVAAPADPLDLDPALPPPPGLRLPDRPAAGHKGTFGTVLVVAGAQGFSGAAYLSAMGAARGGAGLVRLCVPAGLHAVLAVKCTEVMPHPLPDAGRGVIGPESVRALREDHLAAADALVVGPGLGRAEATREAVAALLTGLPCPAVVDADGLNCAAMLGLDWRRAGAPVVVTPHPAEMARLLGGEATAGDVQADREGTALGYAAGRGCVVVLKGARTVVAAPDGRLHVDGHSLVALATGGTGDVLAGLCGAMLAAGLDAFDAAVAAVTVHAEAGARVEAERGRAGALAGDLLEALPAAQERLRRALERAGR